MNRKWRRELNRKNKTHYSKQDFDLMVAQARIKQGNFNFSDLDLGDKVISHMDNEDLFPNGTKVKINYERIHERPTDQFTPTFNEWIEANKDKEFTLTREGSKKSLVCLAEDIPEAQIAENGETLTREKWLFDLYSDLLIWDKNKKEYRYAFEIQEDAEAETDTKTDTKTKVEETTETTTKIEK